MKRTEIVSVFKKTAFGLVLTVGAASFVMAQQKAAISGSVRDANGSIGYSSVTFKNTQNSQLSDAALADVNGNYQLELVPGNYEVTIEAVDYKKTTKTVAVTKPGPIAPFMIVSEGKANLNNTTDIQGVVITATSTKPYKVELDKKTYDVKSDLTAIGGNLQDVLQNVPSVSVDTDGTVSMRGSSNVRFLINGKPSALLGIDDGANALQAIPADQIDRIEVITNPSAKYDASGTAGILNIILKKTSKLGFNGSVIGTLGYLPRTGLNTNLSWKKGSWSWFLNGGGGYQEGKNTSRNDITYTTGDIAAASQNSESNSKSENYNAMAGVTFDLSPKTSFNLSGNIRSFANDNDNPIDYFDYNRDGTVDFTTRNSLGRNTSLGFQGDFGVDQKLDDKGQNISASLSLQSNKSNNRNDITQITNNALDYYNFTRQETENKSMIVKVDYELPIGENSMFNAGYKLDDNQNNYDNLVLQQDEMSSPTFVLPAFTGVSNYNETFNAGYIQFKSKFGPIGYQVGLRNEHSKIEFSYPDTITGTVLAKNKDYNNLFPSVFLSYDFAKNNQLLLNYSRRIDRPRSWFLIPFFSFNNSRNLFSGNPDLNPSYIDSFEFGYNYSKSKLTINPTLYYRKEKDNVQMAVIQSTTEASAFNIKPFNVGDEDRFGLDLNGTYDPFAWWKIMGNVDLFGYKTQGDLYIDNRFIQSYNGEGFSTRFRLSNTFKFDKTFSVQIQGNFRGAQKNASQNQKSIYFFNLGATKTIWKGDGTLAFNIQDIFNTRARQAITYGANFQNEMYMQWQPRQMSISLTYRFKQGEKVEQPKRKKDINANDSGGDDMPPM